MVQYNNALIHLTELLGKIRQKENSQSTFMQQLMLKLVKSGTTLTFDVDPIFTVGKCASINRCNIDLISSTERHKQQSNQFYWGKIS